jgi:hypothetical protein
MSQTINNAPGEEKATITVVEDVRRGAPTEAVVKKQIDELNAGHSRSDLDLSKDSPYLPGGRVLRFDRR